MAAREHAFPAGVNVSAATCGDRFSGVDQWPLLGVHRGTTLVWWIDDHIDGAEDFHEWSGALERADAVRARLITDGWIDVT